MYIKHERKYSGDILISKKFVTHYINRISKRAVSLYLMLVMYSSSGDDVPILHISDMLGISEDDILDELSVMSSVGLIKIKGDTVTVLDISEGDEVRADYGYTPEEIAASNDRRFSTVRNAVEKSFSKLLSAREINRLTGIVEDVDLPAEVIVLVVEYIAGTGKNTLSAIEKTAIKWAEDGINTTEIAHEYLSKLENTNRLLDDIRIRFYANERAFSKKDREYVSKWSNDFSDEEIMSALEKTVNSTTKLSFSYADTVLYPKQSGKAAVVRETGAKKSRFNNFSHKKVDYKEIEDRAMIKLMNRRKKGE